MELKDFLKNDRINKGISQEEYAKALNIGRTTLTHLENGRTPSIDTIEKLVTFFGKPFDEILGKEKVEKISELETTNMVIDSLIEKQEIKENYISKEAKNAIWSTLELEIKLKLEMRKKRN